MKEENKTMASLTDEESKEMMQTKALCATFLNLLEKHSLSYAQGFTAVHMIMTEMLQTFLIESDNPRGELIRFELVLKQNLESVFEVVTNSMPEIVKVHEQWLKEKQEGK